MKIKKIEDARDLRVGDVVMLVGHDTHNYASNDPLGWYPSMFQVVGRGTYLNTPDCSSLQRFEKTGEWPHEMPELGDLVDVFNGETGVIRAAPGEDACEVFLCWRKGEFNDETTEPEHE